MNRSMHLITAVAVVATMLFVGYQTVFAHAGYDRSLPARDEVLAEAPDRVEVFFTQDVIKREGAFFVRVVDESGTQVSEGDGAVNDDDRGNINADLQPALGPGRYIVEWMSTSDIDGDTEDGAFCFYVGVEPTAGQEAECAAFEDDEPVAPTLADDRPVDPTPTLAAPSGDSDDDDESNSGLIIGIIVAVVAAVAIVGGGLVWLSRRE